MTYFMRIKEVIVIGMLAVTATPALADHPDSVRVRSLTYAGSGCPAGSVAGNVSADAQAFTLLFSSYYAEVGPGVPFREKRKNCQLLIDFDYPRGWSFSIFTVDVRGYVALERGVTGTQQTSFYHQGSANTATLKTVLSGPRDQNYQIRDTLPLESQQWSSCADQRAVNLNTQVKLESGFNSNRRGLMTVDSIDGAVTLIYGVAWRRC